ncbi:protein SRC2 homolog [Salvia miltiorrhiza]|uniref:protein SRC2 homolog n=1 Tax=Salvia miltiorrhiza TaxID=226208 RepID=UPI0025AD7A7F|nr:protein SRC2 homolog [Salvia miltiorrhiza]
MGSRRLELTIVGAENLPDIRRLGRMKVYAVVSVDGCTGATNTDRDGETNPTWDFPFVYNISEAHLRRAGLDAVVDLYCETTLAGDKLVGRVVIPVKTLFDKGITSQSCLGFPVAGTVCGRLYIRYCFEEKDLPRRNQAWERLTTQQSYYFSQDYYNY